MPELALNQELYEKIRDWMRPKYALTTYRNRSLFLKRLFKQYQVLNQDTLRKIFKGLKHQHERSCLCLINKYCFENGIDFYLHIPGIKKQANKLPEVLSIEEIRTLISAAPHPYSLAIRCIFNIGAGLRVSEIIKMSWNHIKWADWVNNKESFGLVMIKSGKGSKDRVVNIPNNLMKDLYAYAESQSLLNEFRIPSGGMVFPFEGVAILDSKRKKLLEDLFQKDMERWKDEYIRFKYDWFRYNIWKKCCEKALNRKIKIHSLRHSRATYLYEFEQVPIEKIQILLGHNSLTTTMIYTRVNPRSTFELLKETKEI